MIGRLKGTVAAVGEGQALIDVGGVGYLIHAGSRTLAKLAVNEAAEVFVETQMSESSIRLFGFVSGEERAWFSRLQDAPGVGAKVALSILDALTLPQLMDAIALGDTTSITRANGVGKKLAERIVTEFKGKPPPMGLFASNLSLAAGGPAPPPSMAGARADAVSALVNLGYNQADAARAVAQAARDLGEGAKDSALIRAALKALAPVS
ncbi:MAG TPA: Holliday junction branch migration protein RuvA [Hyphomonadaceae bacterium]|jgi:Holliday junction DNA helicase RuvA|nr:Holliday junction branch migration protein RuvA [Hyphomonadaceae bacterium]